MLIGVLSNSSFSVILSFKKSFHELKNISSSCHGIMTLENTFFGAFIIKNNQKIHSIYEIPPFGKYNDSQYKGLRSDRIDCLFISYDMETGIGSGTTINNRYKNYIVPYSDYLLQKGAKQFNIEHYGRLIKL